MKRLLVVEIDTERETTYHCGSCVYSTIDFCELFHKSSSFDDIGMLRIDDCFSSERRYLDPSHRQFDLERYEHPRNNKFNRIKS